MADHGIGLGDRTRAVCDGLGDPVVGFFDSERLSGEWVSVKPSGSRRQWAIEVGIIEVADQGTRLENHAPAVVEGLEDLVVSLLNCKCLV